MTTQNPHLQAVRADDLTPATETATDSGSPSGAPPASPPGGRSTQKPRAERALPTDRLTFEKQVDVLRAIAQMSGNQKRPVTAEELSAAIGLKGGTGGLSNRFFCDAGWVEFAGRGNYAASEALMEFYRQISLDPDSPEAARSHLKTTAKAAWFWEALEPMLGPGGLRANIALIQLSKAASATEHTTQLNLIITWLEWVGLLRRDGELLFAADGAVDAVTPDQPVVSSEANEIDAVADRTDDGEPAQETAPTSSIDDSLVSFSFSVRITADDAAKLSEEQLNTILAFAEKLRG